MKYVWTVVLIVSLAVEGFTMNLVTIWVALGALVALLISFFIENTIVQILIFFATTILTLIFTRKFLVDVLKVKSVRTNLDSVIGQVGIVEVKILPDKPGRITVAGKSWAAISDDTITKGEKVDIMAIEGVKLIVKRRDE